MTDKKSSLADCLTGSGTRLAQLASEARRLEDLRLRIVRHLPPELSSHCVGADIRNGELAVFLDSAVWATALRYQQRPLLEAVQKETGQTCTRLAVRVLPGPAPGLPPRPKPRSLSAATRSLLESTARTVSHSVLAAALRRLAGNRKS